MRPIMTAAELEAHRIGSHGRDYSRSDDGYSDMEVAAEDGWQAVSGWGRDGWDLGDWPYVVVSVRNRAGRYEMRQTCEGDTTAYAFDSQDDRSAAIDYLFVWYGMGHGYDKWEVAGLTYDKRDALDSGTLRVPAEFRGPFSWKRCDAEASA